MHDDSQLSPIDDRMKPIILAIGQAVLGVAALELLMRLHIGYLRAAQDGLTDDLSAELTRLEHLTGGQLLKRLRKLDLPVELVDRIGDVIERRNYLIHHPIEDESLMLAGVTGVDVDAVVTRIERLSIDCQQIGNELSAIAFPALLGMLGVSSMEQLADLAKTVDLDQIPQDLRPQFEFMRSMIAAIDLPDGEPAG